MVSPNLCLFCYKHFSDINQLKTRDKDKLSNDKSTTGKLSSIERFLVLLKRFVKPNENLNQRGSSSTWSSTAQSLKHLLGCCESCDAIIAAFCSMYHQMKVLEFQLEWKVETLVNIMKFANRVPSRVAQLKQAFQNFQHVAEDFTGESQILQAHKSFKHFRGDMVKECSMRLFKAQPQVLVKRVKNTVGSTELTDTGFRQEIDDHDELNRDNQQESESGDENSNTDCVLKPFSRSCLRDSGDDSVFITSLKKEQIIIPEHNNESTESMSITEEVNVVYESTTNAVQSEIEASTSEFRHWQNPNKMEEGVVLSVETFSGIINPVPSICKAAVVNNEENKNQNGSDSFSDHGSDVNIYHQEEDDYNMGDNDNDIIPSYHMEELPPENGNEDLLSLQGAISSVKVEAPVGETENEIVAEIKNRRYNLRPNRKRVIPLLEPKDEREGSISSKSSFSDSGESESTSSEEDTDEIRCQRSNTSLQRVSIKRDKKNKSENNLKNSKVRRTYYKCREKGCLSKFGNKQRYELHQKLHNTGEQKCNFCQVLQNDVVLLSIHENETHLPEEKRTRNDGQIYCPRCPFSTRMRWLYQAHFAERHIEEFKNVDRVLKDNLDSEKVKKYKCREKGCFTLFQNKLRYEHHQKLHTSCEQKCNFCEVVETDVILLSIHENEAHLSQEKRTRNDGQIYCPRCPFSTRMRGVYQVHFAGSHIEEFKTDVDSLDNSNLQSLYCEKDGCSRHFQDKVLFQYHQTLHAPSEQKCKFCGVARGNVILLSTHENEVHPSIKTTTENNSNNGLIYCPRCPFTTGILEVYQVHFAETHIAGFDKLQRQGRMEKDEVGIAKTNGKAFMYRCRANGCCRNFKNEQIFLNHQKLHTPNKQKCHFCEAVLDDVVLLSKHEREEHSSRELTVTNIDYYNRSFNCPRPRCTYKSKELTWYEFHFAEKHIEGFGRIPIKEFQKRNTTENECYYYCREDGCSLKFFNIMTFDNHQKLHTSGEYRCHFCNAVEENLIKLSVHENKMHLRSNGDDDESDDKVICCPRCQYKGKSIPLYQAHFASAHFEGYEEAEENTLTQLVRCEMCNLEIDSFQKSLHFSTYHDLSLANPADIRKCTAEGCDAVFAKPSLWITHMRNEHPSEPNEEKQLTQNRELYSDYKFSCTFSKCKQAFQTEADMETHLKLHGSFQCKFCKVVKNYAPELALHERCHAKKPKKGVHRKLRFRCARCPSYFFEERLYTSHHLKEHLNLSGQTLNTNLICPICKAGSSKCDARVGYLRKQHHQSHHNTEGMDPSQIQRCDLCPAYFVTSAQLGQHKIRIHFSGKCPECKELLCTAPAKFLQHLDEKHPEVDHFPGFVFRCNINDCIRRFGTETDLSYHKKHDAHYDNTLTKCSKCGKEFQGEIKLRNHMYNFHSKNSYVCPQCGKCFVLQSAFLSHLEHHKNPEEWKFECPTCGKKCVNKCKLEEHLRTHSSEKPFCCQFCGERYAHRHNLRHHVQNKHKEALDGGESETPKAVRNYVSRKGFKKGHCILSGQTQ